MTKFMSAAFAASILVPAILMSAAPAQAQTRETVTATVRHRDLDLRKPEHRAMLDARLRRAAAIACGHMTRDLRINGDITRCRAEMRADSAVKVAALTNAPVMLASTR
ncbi:MAG: UrcA family protein [Sphingomonas pseudosanguinis]|uniref:UrcA family protein n=1 Tax=Sphingomonas pseudosanguinis TaxID=413712 RepID=UPI00391A9B1D